MRAALLAGLVLACSGLRAQEVRNYILAERRGGVIEVIEPATLRTAGELHFDVRNTAGLNGVASTADGTTLYVEGPIAGSPPEAGNCCFLYAIDVATLRTAKAAGIRGTHSRDAFVNSGGIMYRANEISSVDTIATRSLDEYYFSSDHHVLFGIHRFQQLVLDVFDLNDGSVTRRMAPERLKNDGFASGAWSRDKFYFYVAQNDGARLWTVSPESTQLGPGVTVEPFGLCQREFCPKEIVTAGEHLFVYERFGSKADPRDVGGAKIPGGVWLLDPQTGKLLRHDAPNLHFTTLIPDRTEPTLYGVAAEGTSGAPQAPVELVRIDARDGHTLASRPLDVDYWWIAEASLRSVPSGEIKVTPWESSAPSP